MFGVGWTEMLVLGVVALIVIGPKDLPVLMNRLGKAVAAIRKMGNEFQRELNKATGLEQVTDLRKSITEPLKQTAAQIQREFNKPLSGGGVAPSGAIKPADPKAESVVNEIHDKLGMPPPAKPAGTPAPVKPEPVPEKPKMTLSISGRPRPAEDRDEDAPAPPAKPAVKKPQARKPRAKVAAAASEPAAPAVAKPAKPRQPRKPKATADGAVSKPEVSDG
jgi:sec-independent protein translocase protein TatB